MPWKPANAKEHVRGLSPHQATVWARVANAALRSCMADGGSTKECDGRAIRQANAVAQRAPVKAIKAETVEQDGALSILAIPFGGPFEGGTGAGVDGEGEFFTEQTDLALDWFPTQRPLLFHHGLDDEGPAIKAVGRVDVASAKKGPEGWWVQAWLDKQGDYFKEILRLLDEDALFASTGAMPHLVRTRKSGEITQWPWVELSLTPTPANFFATVEAAAAKAHYKAAGLTPPPTIDEDDTRPYTDQLDRLTADIGDFTDFTVRLTEGKQKVGRALSEARRKKLGDLMARMRDSASEIEALLAETGTQGPRALAAAESGHDSEGKAAEVQEERTPGATQKAAGHAPELESIYRQFQETYAFYEKTMGLPTKETAGR